MAYPAPFHRLVLIGSLYADTWNTTLSMIPTGGGPLPAVSDELLEDVALAVGDWFNNPFGGASPTGIGIIDRCNLSSVKLNRIGADGKYMDAETKEHVFPTPIVGPTSVSIAPQLTLAATLRGSNERARAGRGRMYLPPSTAITGLNSDGRVLVNDALAHVKGFHFLLGMLNDVYTSAGVGAVAGIASKTGTGAFQAVVQSSVGRVIDTIRSRRNKLDEDPQFWGAP